MEKKKSSLVTNIGKLSYIFFFLLFLLNNHNLTLDLHVKKNMDEKA